MSPRRRGRYQSVASGLKPRKLTKHIQTGSCVGSCTLFACEVYSDLDLASAVALYVHVLCTFT